MGAVAMVGCRRALVSAVLVTLTLQLSSPFVRARPAPHPRETATVGVLPFSGSEASRQNAYEVIREMLEAYGFQVKAVDAKESTQQAFAADPDLDFVIRGVIDDDAASALVFRRGSDAVRRLESVADRRVRDLAAKVLRHVSSESSIESIVATRKQRASAKLEQDPDDFDSLVLMGLAMRHESNLSEAIRLFEKAVEVDPRDPDAYYSLALCLDEAGESEDALQHFHTALRLDPNHEAASIALANSHLNLGQVNEAIAVYRQMLQSPLNASLANWNLSVAYRQIGDVDNALRHLRDITTSDPQYTSAQQAILELDSLRAKEGDTSPVKEGNALTVGAIIATSIVALLVVAALVWLERRHRSQSGRPATVGLVKNAISVQEPIADTAAALSTLKPSTGSSLPSPSASSPEPKLARLRDYDLIRQLGAGGMGTVYLARHQHLQKVVALKVLQPALTIDPRAVERFRREMRAVGKLDHPNIVRATDAGESGGRHFLVMEFIQGIDLSRLIKQHGPLTVADACELIRQAAIGLQHAHEANLIHRDIKPSNLILAHDGRVKVLDLGLARLQDTSDGGDELTAQSERLGTPDYMAPEQAMGTGNIDIRGDIYSLGCTLYALLTGQAPFAHYTTPLTKAMAHAHELATPIQIRRPDTPKELASILDRMVAKSPGDRFTTPAEVAQELAPFAASANVEELLKADPNVKLPDDSWDETAEYIRK